VDRSGRVGFVGGEFGTELACATRTSLNWPKACKVPAFNRHLKFKRKPKLKTTIFAVLVILMSGSSGLFADDLTWAGPNGSNWSGFYTSPYYANDNSVGPPPQSIQLFCLDFNDEIAPPSAWTASITTLNLTSVTYAAQYGGSYNTQLTNAFNSSDPKAPGETSAPQVSLNSTLSSAAASYTSYLEAAWLFTGIQSAIGAGDGNTALIDQVAAWELFVNAHNSSTLTNDITGTGGTFTYDNYLALSSGNYMNGPLPTGLSTSDLSFTNAVALALSAAQNAVVNLEWGPGSHDYGSWSIVTGTPGYVVGYGLPVQEFLTPTAVPDQPPVPEPQSVVLFGTVIIGISWAMRRRFKTAV